MTTAPHPLFVLAAVLAGVYIVGSVLSAVGTVWPQSVFGQLEAHEFVTKPLASPLLKAAVLASETVTTVLLWIGLSIAKNTKANGLAAGGYVALLVWLIGYSFKRTIVLRPLRRRVGLLASWVVFSALFVSAAAVLTAGPNPASNVAQGFVWAHASHRLVIDGVYTLMMLMYTPPRQPSMV